MPYRISQELCGKGLAPIAAGDTATHWPYDQESSTLSRWSKYDCETGAGQRVGIWQVPATNCHLNPTTCTGTKCLHVCGEPQVRMSPIPQNIPILVNLYRLICNLAKGPGPGCFRVY